VNVAEACGIKVLVVEDDQEICHRICWSLGAHGYQAEAVAGPREALTRLQHEDFAAIVADLRLTRTPALDLVREVQTRAGFRPWVIYTGVPCLSAPRRYEQQGVFCILMKGAPMRDLLWSVEAACRTARRGAQARCA
jgi:DNA-binding NtrC family response regulator